jgi:uncharacterized protein YhaN
MYPQLGRERLMLREAEEQQRQHIQVLLSQVEDSSAAAGMLSNRLHSLEAERDALCREVNNIK